MLNAIARQHDVSLDADMIHAALLPIAALAIGIISCGPQWFTMGLAILFPVLFFHARSRPCAFVTALFYFMGVSRALAMGVARYYDHGVLLGVGIWFAGNMCNALIYALCWHKREGVRFFSAPLAMILTAIPPFGVFGWSNPLTAAGVIFPGSSFAGLLYLLGLYGALAARSRLFFRGFVLLSLWCLFTSHVPSEGNFGAVATHLGSIEGNFSKDFNRQRSLVNQARSVRAPVVVLPEGLIAGGWNEVSQRLWQRSIGNKTVVLGSTIRSEEGPMDNAMVAIGVADTQVYLQRQPVPLSMWRPFSSDGYLAHWFDKPILTVGGEKIAPLICYEAFLVWPVVESMLFGAKRIVAIGNYWWADGKEIPSIQRSVIKSWSRLFSVPATIAVNT